MGEQETGLRTPIISDGRVLNPQADMVYEFLAYMEPGLLVDVGAAAGGFTTLMYRRSPQSRVFAFEPFPGNWPLLDAAASGIDAIVVDRRAASDTNGASRLYVSQVVTGDEEGWADKQGYSSAGTLVDEDDARFEKAIDVETVRLDTIVDEQVRFLKIDVQGAELAVLRGAHGLLERNMIDFMWVEFTGELDILEYLFGMGFLTFDSPYLMIPRSSPPSPDDWDIVGTKNLSNGRQAFLAWPHEYPRRPDAYCDWLQAQKAHYIIQTDLTFVHRDFVPTYLGAAAAAIGAVRPA